MYEWKLSRDNKEEVTILADRMKTYNGAAYVDFMVGEAGTYSEHTVHRYFPEPGVLVSRGNHVEGTEHPLQLQIGELRVQLSRYQRAIALGLSYDDLFLLSDEELLIKFNEFLKGQHSSTAKVK